uniref:Uncharacterized protein n=1 Tax=Parascaris univalens TaxID=6257 RepID=A0A915CLR2_PARUN
VVVVIGVEAISDPLKATGRRHPRIRRRNSMT